MEILTFFGKKILQIAPDDDFITTKIDLKYIPPPNAIFTTKSDRNLKFLVDAWHQIKKTSYKSKLFINPPFLLSEDNKKDDINLRKKADKKLLIQDLINSKVFLTPGHKTEVFCLAAEEARELCIPIVTLGIGSLSERVINYKTGFIASNNKDFAELTIELFTNDSLWKRTMANHSRKLAQNHVAAPLRREGIESDCGPSGQE